MPRTPRRGLPVPQKARKRGFLPAPHKPHSQNCVCPTRPECRERAQKKCDATGMQEATAGRQRHGHPTAPLQSGWSGWTSKVDPASGKTYYVSSSGQSQWNKPTIGPDQTSAPTSEFKAQGEVARPLNNDSWDKPVTKNRNNLAHPPFPRLRSHPSQQTRSHTADASSTEQNSGESLRKPDPDTQARRPSVEPLPTGSPIPPPGTIGKHYWDVCRANGLGGVILPPRPARLNKPLNPNRSVPIRTAMHAVSTAATSRSTFVDRRLADLEPESPSSWVLVAMVPFFLTLIVLTHLFFRRATVPRKPISRGTRIVRKKAPIRIIYEL